MRRAPRLAVLIAVLALPTSAAVTSLLLSENQPPAPGPASVRIGESLPSDPPPNEPTGNQRPEPPRKPTATAPPPPTRTQLPPPPPRLPDDDGDDEADDGADDDGDDGGDDG